MDDLYGILFVVSHAPGDLTFSVGILFGDLISLTSLDRNYGG